jgi:hypothetical protein
MVTIDEKIRMFIGDLVVRNIALDDQVSRLAAQVAELEKLKPEKKK